MARRCAMRGPSSSRAASSATVWLQFSSKGLAAIPPRESLRRFPRSCVMPPESRLMTSDERSAYESECLEQTRLFLERLVDEPSVPQKLREAKLTGSYPDTEISVRWYDTRFDKEKSRSYRLWRHAL